MNRFFLLAFTICIAISTIAQPNTNHDLKFLSLAESWDEGMPLGNGMIGALIWQKGEKLRFSLDRADLWDLRPMKGLHRKEFSYDWVGEQVRKKEYKIVQEYFDAPYDREPGPTKIPGAALEFEIKNLGILESTHLLLNDAVCEVRWANGTTLKTFVHATKPIGWFRFENITDSITPELIAPKYQGEIKIAGDPVGGDDLSRLGYKQGLIAKEKNSISYTQHGWGGFSYTVSVRWKKSGVSSIEGNWSISAIHPGKAKSTDAKLITALALKEGYQKNEYSHKNWWRIFWNKSAIQIPDSVLEKQWYLEQYKFGSASRRGAPPISLQSVWTADNGRIPPWKGDYHHDLNTQLSYWPAYSGNHLEEGLAYLDHLDQNKANYKRYTRLYFNKPGLAVPGVSTLDGTEMGGWIQYSLSPTVSAWLAHHYYLHWRYSMDRIFLKTRAYPWIKETAEFIKSITIKDDAGFRKLPISSSPEINDNHLNAWFHVNTNYDLALMRFCVKMAAELADELGMVSQSEQWESMAREFRDVVLTPNDELMFAPGLAYETSHRHFSHAVAIHPLGLIQWEQGEKAQRIIKNTLDQMDRVGPDWWCGYSYAWMASMKARAKDGIGAQRALDIFSKAFCLKNSFHVNGDQTKSGYSRFTYRPFTLEGNFAFAAGLQEMLLQSYAGFIEIMPAIPTDWKDVSFTNLRSEGAFLISARKAGGQMNEVKIVSEKGGQARLKLPFKTWLITSQIKAEVVKTENGFIIFNTQPGGVLVLKNGFE